MKFAYVQPIFCPNEEMFERNSKSVNSFYDYYVKMKYKFQCVFGGYCASDELWDKISSLITKRSKGKAKIIRFDRNYGKAYVVNKLVTELTDIDYFLTADSDILFKLDEPNIIDRLGEAFDQAKIQGLNPSLIALFQEEQNCHLLELCYQSKYYYDGKFGKEMICKPNTWGGVAGGCICISKPFWDLIGGYKVLGVYASDDANIMRDSYNRGYHFMLSDTIKCIHPFDTNQEYCEWKRKVCPTVKELNSAIEEANSFWNRDEGFSYVIPHRSSTGDRKRNLDYVISYLRNNFKNVEIIVVEQDIVERYTNPQCTKVMFNDVGPFKRSECLNIGFSKSKFNKVIFADNDLLVPHEQIRASLELLNTYDVVNPYSTVRDLDEPITDYLVRVDNFSVLTRYSERGGIVFSGGACCFTREGYSKIGGYDEEFIGWGGEDNACTHKIQGILKYTEVSGHCWHMNHSRHSSNNLHNDYAKNIATLNYIQSLSGDGLEKYCAIKRQSHGW